MLTFLPCSKLKREWPLREGALEHYFLTMTVAQGHNPNCSGTKAGDVQAQGWPGLQSEFKGSLVNLMRPCLKVKESRKAGDAGRLG